MASILFTWEFGAGLGHLTRMLPVARRLYDAGHRLTIVAQRPQAAAEVIDRHFPGATGVQVLQGPFWPAPRDPAARQVPTAVLADVVRLFEFQNVDKLRAMIARWEQVVATAAPDLVVADFSPTLALTVKGRLPLVMLGNGYTIPPAGRPLPPMRPWRDVVHPFSRAHEAEMTFAVNRAQHHRQGPAIDHFADLFNGDASCVCTIPAFDPYARYRSVPTLTPFNIAPIIAGPPLAERPEDTAALYMDAGHPALAPVLQALERLPQVRVEAYIANRPDDWMPPSQPAGVTFRERPLDFAEVLPRCRLLIHHAGLGTAYAAVLAGTPQLVLPLNLEHAITAHGCRTMGVARVREVRDALDPETLAGDLAALLHDPVTAAAAARAAAEVPRDGAAALDAVVETCSGFLPSAADTATAGVPMRRLFTRLFDRSAPAAETPPLLIGATGGSGTRAVQGLLADAGFFMGTRLNEAGDAMDFEPFLDAVINPLLQATRSLDYRPADLPGPLAGDIDERFAQALSAFRQDRPEQGPWGWKNPRSMFVLPLIADRFPGMGFVHLVRDGRDMAFSVNQNQPFKHYAALFGDDFDRDDERAVRLASIALWQRANLDVARWGERHLGDRYVRIRFEDLCAAPRATMDDLIDRLGLPPQVAETAAARVKAPASIGRWRDRDAALAAAVQQAGHEALDAFGYL